MGLSKGLELAFGMDATGPTDVQWVDHRTASRNLIGNLELSQRMEWESPVVKR